MLIEDTNLVSFNNLDASGANWQQNDNLIATELSQLFPENSFSSGSFSTPTLEEVVNTDAIATEIPENFIESNFEDNFELTNSYEWNSKDSLNGDETIVSNSANDFIDSKSGLETAIFQAQKQLELFANNEDFSVKMNQAFGEDLVLDEAKALIEDLASGETSLKIEVIPTAELKADGAFGEETIYLSEKYLDKNVDNPEAVSGVLLEEIGHYVDRELNLFDAPGDEGEIFAKLVKNETINESELEELKTEDDSKTIFLNGKDINVELASLTTADVLIQAGHEGRTSGLTGATGPLGNEIDWTPVVADEATRILEEAGVSVIRANADEIKGETYNVKDAVFIHFDGSKPPGTSGASIGYDDDTDKPAADAWKELYSQYWPYKWQPDNLTENLSQYYGFSSTNTSDAELVLELGDISGQEQAEWLQPRLEWEGALLAHFLSERIGEGNVPDPGPYSSEPPLSPEDEYLVGDWDGDGTDNIAVRRGNQILKDTNFDGIADEEQLYGNGNAEDEYLVGDWDKDGTDEIAVRRGNQILMDFDGDGIADEEQLYGNGNAEDEYLVGDWDKDGTDEIAVRRGNQILMDFDGDGIADEEQLYGNGNAEDEYLVGDWNKDGTDEIAVRRGNQILMDTNFDGIADEEQLYGNGNAEDEYLVGDWNKDGTDEIAVRRGNQILMDTNFDGTGDIEQVYGNGTENPPPALPPESIEFGDYDPVAAAPEFVTDEFLSKVFDISQRLEVVPEYLMAVMGFETGESYDPAVKNPDGSATGLIQFLENTAEGLGTSTKELAAMSAVEQLDYVEKYFSSFTGSLNSLEDTYLAVLYPLAIGEDEVFVEGTEEYERNKGLDTDENGVVTAKEAADNVRKKLPGSELFAAYRDSATA